MSDTQNIEALAITCIDYRFVTKISDFLEKEGLKEKYDLIAYPGASKSIYLLIDAIDVSVRLHHPKKIMVIDHETCGAFGENNSIKAHQDSLGKSMKILKVIYPDIAVENYIAQFSSVEKVLVEEEK